MPRWFLALASASLAACSSTSLGDLTFACGDDDECALGARCHPITRVCAVAACGDGAVDPAEECDDGNLGSDDGCTASCALERGAVCSGEPSVCSVCGDSRATEGETCDDGNRTSGDGCTATCALEPGYTCDEAGCSRCGDGVRAPRESCDDAGASGGCVECRVQFGFRCAGGIDERSVCTAQRYRAISAGARHNCGITTDGALDCTGANDMADDDPRYAGQATPPPGLPPLRAVSAGSVNTCGITAADDRAVCWGSNMVVYQRDHDVALSVVPADLGPVRELVTRSMHVCAVTLAGALRCWGYDGHGQAHPPLGVPSHHIAVGMFHSCALRDADLGAHCFGESGPKLAAPAGRFTDLAIGLFHTCGILEDGTLRCWDKDVAPSSRARPPADADFTSVVAAQAFTCALHRSGRVRCFGDALPEVPTDTFTALTGGIQHVCGLRADGTVACWGKSSAFAR